MGAWFESILIKSEDSAAVQSALREVSRTMDCQFLVGPAINGWISIFSSDYFIDAAEIAKRIDREIFHFHVHDDDTFNYSFYRGGALLDEYVSRPEESQDEFKAGNPELYQDLIGENLDELKKLLSREKKFVFENERMSEFVELLGLPNALGSYKYIKSGDVEVERADEFIEISEQPQDANTFDQRGQTHLAASRFQEAIQDFDKAIEIDSHFAQAFYHRAAAKQALNASILEREQRLRDARASEELRARLGARIDEAFQMWSAGMPAKIEPASILADLDKAIALKPDWALAFTKRGELRDAQGDKNGAISDYDRAIALSPTSSLLNKRARLKRFLGNWDEAIADYTWAIAMEPANADYYNNRSLAKKAKGDLAGALSDLDRAIAINPNFYKAHHNRGEVKRAKKDWDGALADYDRAIEINPDLAKVYNSRAQTKQIKKDLHGALHDFDKAVELEPGVFQFLSNRAYLKTQLGDWQGAVKDCDKSIEVNPRWMEAYYVRGEAKRGLRDFDGAIADYTRALEFKPDSATLHNNRGMARREKGDLEGARADFQSALRIKPDFEPARKNLDAIG